MRFSHVSSIHLVEAGCGWLLTPRQRFRLSPGALLYLPPGSRHSWSADEADPMVLRCAYFDWHYQERDGFQVLNDFICYGDKEANPRQAGAQPDFAIEPLRHVDNLAMWVHLFDQFASVQEDVRIYKIPESIKVQGSFYLFLYQFMQIALKKPEWKDPRVLKAIRWIEQEAANPFRVEELARYLGISVSYLHMLFKEGVGQSPKWYWNHCRINSAKRDLRDRAWSVTEISQRHAFPSVHYFSKMFKKMEGQTPSEYRRKFTLY